jgi:hypothetical protein
MLGLYRDYITQNLIPRIHLMLSKYSVWWTFKSNSTLQTYLKEHKVFLKKYFTPEELCISLLNIFESRQMFVSGNNKLVKTDVKLQECFNTNVIYIPEFKNYCDDHITEVSNLFTLNKLQNKKIKKNIIFETSEDLIFNDFSSLFWIHPEINFAINQNRKLVYSWNELYQLFLDFCTTNKDYFIQKPDSIIYINPSSSFANIFKIQCFHRNQIEDVLKTISKYLGKTNTINQYCKHFKTSVTDESVLSVLNIAINNYNKYVPIMITYVDI